MGSSYYIRECCPFVCWRHWFSTILTGPQATASALGRRRAGRDQGHRRATVPRPRLCGQRPRVTSVTGLVHSLGCSSRTIAPAWASPPLQPLAMPAQPTRLVLVGNTTCNGVSLHVSDRAVLTIRLFNDPRAAYQAPHPTTCTIRRLDRQSPSLRPVV
ncbi:hypothetical protein N658DRAFT_334209 [Parathielavia hyrcaniae]|uniref:Uncharacterized protein n=1 Tax=Parathielavia hyrcaniae TaxID=113614 RepID=A0AAN6PRS6_9PEZI|nr:hypothetical protein N658DRAFT_334209 [Parathielavia hyrcaniae]